jgi:uncharacterized protein YndB with AHSA1/START domain
VGKKRAERQIVIEGTPQGCFDALTDFESHPQWQGAVTATEVRSRHGDGRGKEVAFEIDAKIGAIGYTLDYRYEEPHLLTWRYVEGDVKDVDGELVLEDRGDGTTLATYALRIDPGAWMPGPLAGILNDEVMKGAMDDLKRRVEAPMS